MHVKIRINNFLHTNKGHPNVHITCERSAVNKSKNTKKADDVIALFGIYLCNKEKKENRKRKWMKEWLQERNTNSQVKLIKKLEITAPEDLKLIKNKEDTVMRDAVTPSERRSATLRLLATGQTYEDLKFLTKISAQSLGIIVLETCEAIITALKSFIKENLCSGIL